MENYRKIVDLIVHGEIPYTTPHLCECGVELVVNENLTQIKCGDPDCIIHNSQKFLDMLDILGIRVGIGDVNSESIMDALGINRPIEIFKPDLDIKNIPSRLYLVTNKLMEKVKEIKNGIEFDKFMMIQFLPILGRTRSKALFSPFGNPEEFYKYIDEEMDLKDYISETLNIASYTDTVLSIKETLETKREQILDYAKWFKFKKSFGKEIYYITITGNILYVKDDDGNIFSNRDKFAPYLSEKFGINIQSVGFSVDKTNILIMDSDMRSNNKYRKATQNNIPVVTSLQFYNRLEELYGNKDEVENKEQPVEENENLEITDTQQEENGSENKVVNLVWG